MKCITSVSLSGGQGKTTLIYFLAKMLAKLGYSVLTLDLDPQHNLSTFLRTRIAADEASILEFLRGETLAESIYPVENIKNLYIIPADDGLEVANDFLAASGMGIIRLKNRLQKLLETSELSFDFCLIDTPPQKSQLCMTGIGASDYFIVTAEPEVKGVLSLNRTLTAVEDMIDTGVLNSELFGVLLFRDKWYGLNRSKESKAAIEQMEKLVDPELIFPPFRESTIAKKAIAENSTLEEVGKPDLAYPFEIIIKQLAKIHEQRHLQPTSR